MADIDLLVPKKRLTASINALQNIGYGTEENLREKFNNHHHYAPLFRPGEFASVELHHNLMHHSASGILPTDIAYKQVETLEINGACLQVLSPTYRLLHNIVHSEIVDRNYEAGMIALRNLSDFAFIQKHYEQQIDWPAINTTFVQHGKEKVLHSYLYLAHRYLGVPFALKIPPLSSFVHHQRCRSMIRWIGLMEIDRRIQRFSAYHICKRYGCPNTPLALTVGRFRYATKIIRKYIGLGPLKPRDKRYH
ncbi:hypothetical protein Nhal_1626 [Nitrosococcus halophilus Nc 4]|uniref:Uncharacterized protein n=2 Tax=Nitrosococcus halophilus TaxID=133539 RepID=D5C2A1_NITHN|nr:hypothetical protein Nhal_1626 [Nitrosococcus halophilus Nc 4]